VEIFVTRLSVIAEWKDKADIIFVLVPCTYKISRSRVTSWSYHQWFNEVITTNM